MRHRPLAQGAHVRVREIRAVKLSVYVFTPVGVRVSETNVASLEGVWTVAEQIRDEESKALSPEIRSRQRTWLEICFYEPGSDPYEFAHAILWQGDWGVLREDRRAIMGRRLKEAAFA